MKKVKIMLAVIAVLATTGGVLAFRISESKRFIQVCTSMTINGRCRPGPCQGNPIPVKFGGNIPLICYSSVLSIPVCNQLVCERVGQTFPQ
jgi:hypothetical protein